MSVKEKIIEGSSKLFAFLNSPVVKSREEESSPASPDVPSDDKKEFDLSWGFLILIISGLFALYKLITVVNFVSSFRGM